MLRSSPDEVSITTGIGWLRGSALSHRSISSPPISGSLMSRQHHPRPFGDIALGICAGAKEKLQRLSAITQHLHVIARLMFLERMQRQGYIARVILHQQKIDGTRDHGKFPSNMR